MISEAINGPKAAAHYDELTLSRHLRLLAAVHAARAELDCIARDTDAPDWRDVETADLLDTVVDLLARMPP